MTHLIGEEYICYFDPFNPQIVVFDFSVPLSSVVVMILGAISVGFFIIFSFYFFIFVCPSDLDKSSLGGENETLYNSERKMVIDTESDEEKMQDKRWLEYGSISKKSQRKFNYFEDSDIEENQERLIKITEDHLSGGDSGYEGDKN